MYDLNKNVSRETITFAKTIKTEFFYQEIRLEEYLILILNNQHDGRFPQRQCSS